MIESLAIAFNNVMKEGLKNKTFDLPSFASSIKPKYIDSFREADKPLIKCRNEDLEGIRHPETDVPFKRRTIQLVNGSEVTGVFPEFHTEFEMKLDENLYEASDRKQFEAANAKLKDAIEHDADLRGKFTEGQIEEILEGEIPDGYTWHHNETPGVMQLVDTETHAKTAHTGGKSIWGGGSENR